jgi:hypothetical protein
MERLGMGLLHFSVHYSAVECFKSLIKMEVPVEEIADKKKKKKKATKHPVMKKAFGVNIATFGEVIRGDTASTPLLHLAVHAAARAGCDKAHPSWAILEAICSTDG